MGKTFLSIVKFWIKPFLKGLRVWAEPKVLRVWAEPKVLRVWAEPKSYRGGGDRLFGYVKPFRPELKVKELDAFKAVYCGLCGQLGRSFGPLARLTLSYDFTFLSMLRWAVGGETPAVELHRCYVNPLKKLPMCMGGEPLEMGADVATIMIYYKLLDNIRDSGRIRSIGWRLLEPVVGAAHRKAAGRRPLDEALMAESINRQTLVERENASNVDAACEPSSAVLAGIFRTFSGDATEQRVLERLGYLIGRYVYLCDALDDMEDDAKSGGYNPFVRKYGLSGAGVSRWDTAREDAAGSLYMTIGEAEKTLALLTLRDFAPIIDNIVTMGLRASVDEILAKKENRR